MVLNYSLNAKLVRKFYRVYLQTNGYQMKTGVENRNA